MIVVIESFKHVGQRLLKKHLRAGDSVYLVDSFVAFHHRGSPIALFFMEDVPPYAQRLIDEGAVKILPASALDPPAIFGHATDYAVQVVEQVFPHYREAFEPFCRHVSRAIGSADAEKVFKHNLCEKIAIFLSANEMWHRVGCHFAGQPVRAYPVADTYEYARTRDLLAASDVEFQKHPNVVFHWPARAAGWWKSLALSASLTGKLLIQTLGSCLGGWGGCRPGRPAKTYSYGITIVSPTRQLADNRRGPEFLIDGDKIKAEEVVLLPLIPLSADQQERMRRLSCDCFDPIQRRGIFSNPAVWLKLAWSALTCRPFSNSEAIRLSANVLLSYFLWRRALRQVRFKHLISHCDFSLGHIGRNIALNQAGVQTWYFTDSMNFRFNYTTSNAAVRHPYWTYMHYDHFVTWHGLLADYFSSHPGVSWQTHIVGCLWADHAPSGPQPVQEAAKPVGRAADKLFEIAVFDVTYGRNFTCSYEEGLRFAEDILRLVEANPGLRVALKEKKQRDIHSKLDRLLGPQLVEQYDRMGTHPRIEIVPHGADASELISASDLVISFPFTSTTYEALAANRPALWHDPMARYPTTPYGKVGGVVTHSYEQLESRVLEVMARGAEST